MQTLFRPLTPPTPGFGKARPSSAQQPSPLAQSAPLFGSRPAQDLEERYRSKLDELRPLLARQITSQHTGWDILRTFGQVVDAEKQARKSGDDEPVLVTHTMLSPYYPDKDKDWNKLFDFLNQDAMSHDPHDPDQLVIFNQNYSHKGPWDFHGYSLTPFGEWVLKQPRLSMQG